MCRRRKLALSCAIAKINVSKKPQSRPAPIPARSGRGSSSILGGRNPARPEILVAKHSRSSAAPVTIRTRRTYFDCQFGQLHVRTAFPSSGGFDEQVTLICLHAQRRLEPQLRSAFARDGARSLGVCPRFAGFRRIRSGAELRRSRCRPRRVGPCERPATAPDRRVGHWIWSGGRPRTRGRSARPGAPVDIGGGSAHGAQSPRPRNRPLILDCGARCRARTRGCSPGESNPRLPARLRPGETREAQQIHQRIGPLLAARSR